jgi:hypothetical protein
MAALHHNLRNEPSEIGCTWKLVAKTDAGAFPDWLCVLEDNTELVVPGSRTAPASLGISKASSIVQSRSYLERRALQLVALVAKSVYAEGAWRLVTIDFGAEARRHESEFLMCFAFEMDAVSLSSDMPYVEVGFGLPAGQVCDPVFELTVKAVRGIDGIGKAVGG